MTQAAEQGNDSNQDVDVTAGDASNQEHVSTGNDNLGYTGDDDIIEPAIHDANNNNNEATAEDVNNNEAHLVSVMPRSVPAVIQQNLDPNPPCSSPQEPESPHQEPHYPSQEHHYQSPPPEYQELAPSHLPYHVNFPGYGVQWKWLGHGVGWAPVFHDGGPGQHQHCHGCQAGGHGHESSRCHSRHGARNRRVELVLWVFIIFLLTVIALLTYSHVQLLSSINDEGHYHYNIFCKD